jgi:periplasmic divalent cation tolerance protein
MPDDQRAENVAATLINERLAACVNIFGPVISVYHWKGAVEREAERQMMIKTTRDRIGAVAVRLRELHPYELPEFVVLPAESGEEYGRWVRDTVVSPGVEMRPARRRPEAKRRR